jgi:hypothetical protein
MRILKSLWGYGSGSTVTDLNLLIKMNVVLAVAEGVVLPREELEAALFAALTILPVAAAAEEAECEQDASC